MKILEKLWSGNISMSTRKLTLGSKQHKLNGYIAYHEETLIPMLTDEVHAIFEKLKENQSELLDWYNL